MHFHLLLKDIVLSIIIGWSQLAAPTMPSMMIVPVAQSFITTKPFNTPSASMLPTLEVGDIFWVDASPGYTCEVGDVVVAVVHRSGGAPENYVKRIMAGPGDRIAMHDGTPILNGTPVPATRDGTAVAIDELRISTQVERFIETLPGRPAHAIYRQPGYRGQDMPERTIPPGYVFILGDNRDNSLDSRFPQIGLVPIDRIYGPAWMIYWSRDPARILHHIR